MALPALWSGGEPPQIVRTLSDALFRALRPAFVFVRSIDPNGGPPIEMVRAAAPFDALALAREIGDAVDRSSGGSSATWPPQGRMLVGEADVSVVSVRLGLQGEIGVVVAGAERLGFPGQTERLVLDVAANQAVVGLQQARMLSEQRRVADELDARVAQRTSELAAVNEELKREVAERQRAEAALGKTRSEIAHVARVTSLGALTASIAHEVSQPLSGIITNASTCLRMLDADPPDVDGARETARRTIRDGNRASDVITRLRAMFSKREFTLEPLDMNEATREVIALSSSDLQRNRVILESELADDLPRITGDRIQLQQVILNLFLNASDAMAGVDDRPRHVLVRTEREGHDRVRVTVRDAGVGIDRQSVEKLFETFYTTKSGGMGIGLSVSRSIVERHHGRLWAELNDGPGATFSFSVPCDPARAADSAPAMTIS